MSNSTTRRWRHKKRGSVYEEIGRAEVQIATLGTILREGDKLVVYRGENGKLWARPEDEFEDGRFEEINDATNDAGRDLPMKITRTGAIRMTVKEAETLVDEWSRLKSSIATLEHSKLSDASGAFRSMDNAIRAMEGGIMEAIIKVLMELDDD